MDAATVSTARILAMLATLGLSCGLPVFLWLMVLRKEKRLSTAVIAGAIGFIVPQMLIRLPILQVLAAQEAWVSFLRSQKVFVLIFFPLTAALFETAGRLFVLGKVLRSRLSYYTALGAGIGHGGAESIGLIGLTYVNNIIFSILINTNRLPAVEGLEATIKALTETAPSLFLMAGLERVLVIPLHIALSVLMGYYLAQKRLLFGAALCLALHFAVDFGVVLLSMLKVPLWGIQGFLLAVALFSIWLVHRLKQRFSVREIPRDEAEAALENGY